MMLKTAKAVVLLLTALMLLVGPALAQEEGGDPEEAAAQEEPAPLADWAHLAAGIGAGLATIGGAYGIGKLASSAMEGTARQPEAGAMIRTSMIIAAALIEGFTFFALIVTIILAIK